MVPSGDLVHPVLAGTGFLLMGLGFYGLYGKLPATVLSKVGLAAAEAGVLLGIVAMVTWEQAVSESLLIMAFILHPVGLALIGIVALTNRSLGRLSFVPLVIVAAFIGIAITATPGVEGMGAPFFLLLTYAGWIVIGAAIMLHRSEEPSEPMLAA